MNPIALRIMDLEYQIEALEERQSINEANDDWDDNLQIQISDLDFERMALTGEQEKWKPPTLEECAEAIQDPVKKWVSRCHEIATKIHRALKVPGVVQYGFYYGPVDKKSKFAGRPFSRHGWILLKDKRIFDPTRWAFDSPREPYLFCVDPEYFPGEYDFGMNFWRENHLKPPPVPLQFEGTSSAKMDEIVRLPLKNPARQFARDLFGEIPWQTTPDEPVLELSRAQVFWLANFPFHMLGKFAKPIYQSIISAGCSGFIPIDNIEAVGVRDEGTHANDRTSGAPVHGKRAGRRRVSG